MRNESGKKYPVQGILGVVFLAIFLLSILPAVLGLILLSVSIYLLGRQISLFFEKRSRYLLSSYIKVIIAPLLSLFIAYIIVFSLLFSADKSLTGLKNALIYGFLILTFIYLAGFLNTHSGDYHVEENITFVTKKLSVSFFPFVLALFSATQPSLLGLTYAFSFASIVLILTTPFFYYAYNPREGVSKLSGFIISNREFYLISFAIIGFLYGLYIQDTVRTYREALLVVMFLIGIAVVLRILLQGYNSYSSMTQKDSFQVYEKFNKKENVTEIAKITKVGESIKEFETNGKKERILIALSTYLSEIGFTNDDVERFLKPIIDYKLPVPFALDIESDRRRIMREIEKRQKIIDGILRSISRSEKIYEK